MKRHILIFSIILLAMQTYAQHDEQVTVEGKYRPKVNKVNKLQLTPETPQPSYEFPSTEVNPKEAKQKFALDLEKIAPTAFATKDDKLVTPTKNFLMAGIGTRLSPIFLYKHNSMLTKTLELGVGVKHNSSWINIKDYAPSSFMNNAFDISLSTNRFNGWQMDGNLYYKNDMYYYYGVNLADFSISLTDEQIEELCPRQTYNTIGGHLGLVSTSTRVGELSHSGSLGYQYTFDKFGSQEHFVDLNYGIGYTQNWWGDKNHPQKVGVDLGIQYDNFTSKVNAEHRSFFKITPYFEMKDEFYRLHLGVRLDGTTRVLPNTKFLAVRPDLSGSLFVLNKKLEFYAGLNGGRTMLTFSEIVEENPFYNHQGFVNGYPFFRAQNVKLGFEGGARTNIMEIVDLHLGVRYHHILNDMFYKQNMAKVELPVMDQLPILNSYTLIYDETRQVTFLADVRVKMRNSLTADLGFVYNNCETDNEEYAWYRPTMEGKLKLTYDLNDELAFNASFLYQGGRYAQTYDEEMNWKAEKMKDVFDVSLGADYKINDQITAFALLDNVACQKYQLYYNYPVTGIQLFAGVKLRF